MPDEQEKPERKPLPHAFKPGQSGNPGGIPKVPSDVPPILAAMRYVSSAKKSIADKGVRAHCRAMLEKDPASFLKELSRLELAYLKSKGERPNAPDVPAVAKRDEGDEKITELINSLLEGFRNGGKATEVSNPAFA